MELAVTTLAGKAAGKITLDGRDLWYRGYPQGPHHTRYGPLGSWPSARLATPGTQTRSEVSVTTQKFIPPEGVGRALVTASRATPPIFVRGGVPPHGPRVPQPLPIETFPRRSRQVALAMHCSLRSGPPQSIDGDSMQRR